MNRRVFVIGLGSVLTPRLFAEAQQTGKLWRIGVLAPGTATAGTLPTIVVDAFRNGMRDLGYIEDRNITFETRWDEGRPERSDKFARDLVRLHVDVIVAGTTPASIAAKNATPTIPIVMAATGGDPVTLRLVASLSRPGGNVTGLTLQTHELPGKRLEFLKDVVPGIVRAAVFWHPRQPSPDEVKAYEVAARALGVQLQRVEVKGPEDFDGAFDSAVRSRSQAVIMVQSAVYATYRAQIAEIALKRQIPTMSGETGYAERGGLMNYGPNIPDSWRRAAVYVDKILKGANAGTLPIEQPNKFELVINLKTAKALGLTIPPSLLLRADQVIE
jgi:putative tryptophan/tyrosine transport system substrate-binding protein